jgi:hypothetical protein
VVKKGRLIPVKISQEDRASGLLYHLIPAGSPPPPKARRCLECKVLLQSGQKELCWEHDKKGLRRPYSQ